MGYIDTAVEDLVVQHRDCISQLHSLERFHTFVALLCTAYVASITYMLVKPLYHVLPIPDLCVSVVQHTQVMYSAAS